MLSFVTVLTIGVTSNVVTAAEKELMIQSRIVESSAAEFAQSDFGYSLSAILAMEKSTNSPEEYQLTEPFVIEGSIQQEIYFPVLLNNKVEYIYTLIQDEGGNYSANISRFLAEEIQTLKESASINPNNDPITFFLKNNNIFYKQNNVITLLWESPIKPEVLEPEAIENFVLDDTEELSTKTLSEEIDFIEQPLIEETAPIVSNKLQRGVVIDTNYIMIDFVCREVQPDAPWCAAYVTAWILSNKTNPKLTYAYDVMTSIYPKLSFPDLVKKTASYDQIVAFAKSKGSSPIVTNTSLSGDNVRTLLQNGKPLYLGLNGAGNYLNSTHAMALFGWVKQGKVDTYYLWNPWNNYPIVASPNGSSLTVPVPGGSFIWKRTIYNM